MGISNNTISLIELGQRPPTVRELCALSVIYGCAFDRFLDDVLRTTRAGIAENLSSLPSAPEEWSRKGTRAKTLQALAERLKTPSTSL